MITARIQFKKSEEVRFISHLDLQRTIQRALRRGGIDIAYSQGFNPHPKISFAMALAVGMTSEGEYIDIELNTWIDAQELKTRLNNALPKGLEVVDCKLSEKKHPSLMSTIQRGKYQVILYTEGSFQGEDIKKIVKNFLAQEEIIIERTNKKGKRTEKNIRPFIYELEPKQIEEKKITFYMNLATGSQNNIKPEIVIEQLITFKDEIHQRGIRIHRMDLLTQDGDNWVSPLEIFS